jgi:hypothetical protein
MEDLEAIEAINFEQLATAPVHDFHRPITDLTSSSSARAIEMW